MFLGERGKNNTILFFFDGIEKGRGEEGYVFGEERERGKRGEMTLLSLLFFFFFFFWTEKRGAAFLGKGLKMALPLGSLRGTVHLRVKSYS